MVVAADIASSLAIATAASAALAVAVAAGSGTWATIAAVSLQRASWLTVVAVCLIAAILLAISGYSGYCIVVCAVGLAGLPVTLGFAGKWQLLSAAVGVQAWWVVAVVAAGTLVAAGYLLRPLQSLLTGASEDGIDSAPDAEAVTYVAQHFAERDFAVHSSTMVEELELVATDAPFHHGQGLRVEGPVLDLLMVMSGRSAFLANLTGPGVPTLRQRLAL